MSVRKLVSFKFIPCIVRNSITICVRHYIHNTRLRRGALQSIYFKIITVAVHYIVVKTRNNVASKSSKVQPVCFI